MSGRASPFGSRRAPGARERRNSEQTAAAFRASYHGRKRWVSRSVKIRERAWRAEVEAQRAAWNHGETAQPEPQTQETR